MNLNESMNSELESREPGWKGAIAAPILLLCLNLFVFGTMTVYLGNQGEFLVEDEQVLLVLLVPALITALTIGLFAFLGARLSFLGTSAALFLLAFVTYIHGNVLRWESGVLDGSALQTGRLLPVLVDALLWVFMAWLIWRFRHWLAVHGWKLCVLLVVFQLVGAVELKHNAKSGNRQLQEVPEELYAFNDGPNVLHLILDGFQGNIFESLVKEDPAVAADLQGFVFFRDTLTPSAVTYLSVPATLSGIAFDNREPITAYHDRTLAGENLYSVLASHGHEVDVATPLWWNQKQDVFSTYYSVPAPFASLEETLRNTAWYLLDISIFRQVPYPLKPAIYRNGNWWLSSETAQHPENRFQHFAHRHFLDDLIAGANSTRARPTYKLIHVISPHAPLVSDRDCGYAGRELEADFEAFADQSRCILDTVRDLLNKLKTLGIYDEALIMVHGDHGGGVPFDMIAEDGSPTSSFDVLPGMWGNPLPLLMVKPPGATGSLRISERPVSLVDLPSTVADLLGLESRFPGVSLFSQNNPSPRRYYYSSSQHRNDAMEKGRFADFTSFEVSGSIYRQEAWSAKEHFEADTSELSSGYAWGTPLTFGRSGSFKPYGDGGWTVTRGEDVNWTQGHETGLSIPLPEQGHEVRVRFTVKPLLVPGKLERQRVRIEVGGEVLDELELSEDRFATYTVLVPPRLIEDGLLSLRFHLPDAASPADLGSGTDERKLALAFVKVQVDPVP